MRKRTAVIAAGAALFAVPATATAAASDNASCMGQLASADADPGTKGAFASQVARNAERGVSSIVTPAARCEDRG